MLPHRSGTQLADTDVVNRLPMVPDLPPELIEVAPPEASVPVVPVAPDPVEVVSTVLLRVPSAPPPRDRSAVALSWAVGKTPERAWATIHSAWRYAASVALRFCLEISIC